MAFNNTTAQILERAVETILQQIDSSNREGLKDTPRRVARMYEEFFNPEEPKITVFDSQGYDQMVIDKDIPFYSFCEHHMIPFFGTVKIGYIPDKKIIGLSKLARIVSYFSRRLNTQEYLTKNIADYIQNKINPLGVGVVIRGRHLCKEMRGAKTTGEMITSELKGDFRNIEVREEFLRL
jgi:GTP cyclohydrolase I